MADNPFFWSATSEFTKMKAVEYSQPTFGNDAHNLQCLVDIPGYVDNPLMYLPPSVKQTAPLAPITSELKVNILSCCLLTSLVLATSCWISCTFCSPLLLRCCYSLTVWMPINITSMAMLVALCGSLLSQREGPGFKIQAVAFLCGVQVTVASSNSLRHPWA